MNGWFVALALVAGALGVALWLWLEHKRRDKMFALARQMGLSFSAAGGNWARYGQFDVFARGDKRRAFNTMKGRVTAGDLVLRVLGGDFEYREADGSSSDGRRRQRTRRFSYLVVETPWRDTPALRIRREGLLDKVTGALGFEDIDFESAEFSRRFHVASADRKFTYDLITPRVMQFLLAENAPPMQLDNGAILVWTGHGRWRPERFREWLIVVREFVRMWPAHLTDRLPPSDASRAASADRSVQHTT